MAERELTVKIVVDDSMATEKVDALSGALDNLQSTAQTTGAQLTILETQVKALGDAKQVAADKSLLLKNTLQGFDQIKPTTFGGIRDGINGIGEAAGLTYTNMGLMGSAGLVMGAGYAGWGLGRMIADFFDLDKKIGDATSKLLGFGDVAAQTAGAKQDVINKAISNGANAMITYSAAIEYNAKVAKATSAAWKDLADSAYGWQAQLDTLARKGQLDALKKDIEQHILSVKDLETKYTLTAHAVEYYKNQLKDAEAAAKAHEKAIEAAQKASDRAAKQSAEDAIKFQDDFAKNTEAVKHVEDGFYGLGTAAETVGRISGGVLSDQNKDLMKNYEAAKKVEGGAYGIGTAILSVGKASVEAKPPVDGFLGTLNTLGLKAGDLNRIFEAAFTGGGGIVGAVESMATKVTGKLLGMIPIVGPIMSQFAGAIVAGVSKLWDSVKAIFGGPDKDELAARADFAKMFSSVDEALQVIGQRFADVGIDGETARVLIQKLFDATHVSAAAVDAAMKAINDRIAAGADTAANAVDNVTSSINKLGDAVDNLPDSSYAGFDPTGGASYGSTGGLVTASGIQHFAGGGRVLPFRSRGSDTVPAMLTPGEVVLTPQQASSMGGPIHTHVYLNGREIATAVSTDQNNRLRERRLGSLR